MKKALPVRYTDCMSFRLFLIVLACSLLIGLTGCMVKFKASEVEYEGHVKSTSYKLDGLALFNPLKSDIQNKLYIVKGK